MQPKGCLNRQAKGCIWQLSGTGVIPESKEIKMRLENKSAVIYGGGGAIGGAVARAFAGEGARVYLAGRTRTRLEKVANDIGGNAAGVAEVDALDERGVAEHAAAVAADAGGIDIALNAVSFPHVQGTPVTELTFDEVWHPIDVFVRTNLMTAMAVARHMTARQSGTILTLSTPRVMPPGVVGYGTTCAAIEAMTQRLAVDLGPSGVRVVCLPPHAISDAPSHGSYTNELFGGWAAEAGVTVEQMLVQWGKDLTLVGRLPTLAQVADTAVFLASESAGAITGKVVDLTGGTAVRTSQGALVGVPD
jgi:3-oxoacyl-[acyl-carrier protein] reductase